MYKLRCKPAAEAVWDSLPDEARAELDRAIGDVCEDPYGTTEAPRDDEPHSRVLVLQHTAVTLVVFDGTPGVQRIRIQNIEHLG